MDKNGFKAFHFGENIEEDVLADYHYQAAALAQKLRPGTENCSCDMFTVDLYDRETGNKKQVILCIGHMQRENRNAILLR